MSDSEQLQLRVIEYLYGDMSAEQRRDFEQAAQQDSALQQMLEQEQGLNSALPIGTQPQIDEERLQGNRWAVRQRLLRESRPRFSLWRVLSELRTKPLTLMFQGAAMAMTFALGIMVASGPQSETVPVPAGLAVRQVAVPFEFIGDNDYEIYSLRVNNYDAVSGDIDLSFSLASDARVSGNVADQSINRLMAVALQDDIDSAARLDTIDALRPVVAQDDEVYQALIHVLRNDENPGVRYQAVQALVTLRHEESVQAALRYALAEDVNEGVRVEAFNALADYRDPQTLEVFRRQMDNDSNEYIRAQARSIIETVEGADETTVY